MAQYPFLRRAARSPTVAAFRLMRMPSPMPGVVEMNPTVAALRTTGLGFLSDTDAPLGILPVEYWPKADAAVAAAWKLAADLEAKVRARWGDQDAPLSAVATMKNLVQRWSETLERLKHDPSYGQTFSSPQAAIDAWKAWAAPSGDTSFAAWAKQIDATSDFMSPWGMVKDVTYHSAADVVHAAQDTGNALIEAGKKTLDIVKWAPYIALLGGGLLLYLWGRELTAPAGAAIREAGSAFSQRVRRASGGVSGYSSPRRRTRRKRRR